MKSQIGHATYVSWLTLAKEFDSCVHRVVRSNFKQLIAKVNSRSGQKGKISNFINVNKKGQLHLILNCIYQMQFKLRYPMMPFFYMGRPEHAQICI